MEKQKGFAFIPIILGLFALSILGTVGAGALVLTGKAPACQNQGGSARTGDAIGETLDQQGSVTITDGEATTFARSYLGDQIKDPRVCFTKGLGHVSGKINLGSVSPSFYVSGGVDLVGSTPKATNLKIQLGALPDLPFISALAQGTVNKLITDNLGQIELKEKYSADFSEGSLTVTKQ